jgi:two-component system, chemotaxis family, CheB/CheR fusion protein
MAAGSDENGTSSGHGLHEADHSVAVVGIGASAGGVAAVREFFSHVKGDREIAYVVILHLSPHHESSLPELIQAQTSLPVIQVNQTVKVEANHVYVISPNRLLTMNDGEIRVIEAERRVGGLASIDLFLRTLASAHGKDAIAVLLSGSGSDGVLGIAAIKEHGGLVIVQDPDEAEYPDMPRNAINSRMVDLVLRLAEMPAKLIAVLDGGKRLQLPRDQPEAGAPEREDDALRDLLALVRLRSGNDFSHYKHPTVLRRIARRMQVNELTTMGAYLNLLRERPPEITALLRDLLISVTSFFRDRETFGYLEREIVPKLFAGKGPKDQLRVWSVGCATGEEAYSLAMLLSEYAAKLSEPPQIQIFATDIDERALKEARDGNYPFSISLDVSAERLHEFFHLDGGRYQVNKSLRELVLFARHNLLRDPPFSRIDLISCRNLLIYLNRQAQERVLSALNFVLNPDGRLLLGTSEAADMMPDLFVLADKRQRIYSRRGVFRPADAAAGPALGSARPNFAGLTDQRAANIRSTGELHYRLLEEIAPPSVLINDNYEVLHVSSSAGRYLRIGGGVPALNLLNLIHPDLRSAVRSLLLEARLPANSELTQVLRLAVAIEDKPSSVILRVRQISRPEIAQLLYLIIFDEQLRNGEGGAVPASLEAGRDSIVRQLEEELQLTRDQLRLVVEQSETSTEELRASNEELQAINEELRSATEELETGKEELQSVNEELTTVNQEYREKLDEISRANADLQNLMASTDIGTIFLDRDLRIKRYTPRAQQLFNITFSDLGRPLDHFTSKLDYSDLRQDASNVLLTLQAAEREVHSQDGKWYLARLVPYRTLEDRIEGVVLTFVDISGTREYEKRLREQAMDITASRRSEEALLMSGQNKDRFLAMLSHELRNPLGATLNNFELLVRSVPEVAGRPERSVIERQLKNLTRMVDDLMDVQRLTHGKIALVRRRVGLAEIIDWAVETIRANEPDGHDIEVSLPEQAIFLDADPVRLAQVFTNLLQNAIKFTPTSGSVEIIAEQPDSEVVVRIRDTGIGIRPELLPKLFEMYAQGEPSASGKAKGLGVGLALVSQIVEMHGGKVTANSAGLNQGSEFVVSLPLPPTGELENVEPIVKRNGAPAASFALNRVMVVDDNQDAAEAIEALLDGSGFTVRAYHDSALGLEGSREFKPEAAVLDIGLPGMDGFELARRLREENPDILLIALSGWRQDSTSAQSKVFDHYLTKPADIAQIENLLARKVSGQ